MIGPFWSVFILLRLILTVFILITFRDSGDLQVLLLILVSCIVQAIILVGKPQAEPLENAMLMFNEVMVFIYLLLMLALTDFGRQLDPQMRESIGWTLVIIVVSTVLINLAKYITLALTFTFRWWLRRAKTRLSGKVSNTTVSRGAKETQTVKVAPLEQIR